MDAVAQSSKQGYIYLFNRVTGEPLFPITYRPYPPSDVPGEVAAKTQPLPTWPAPFARQLLTEDMLTQRTPEVHQWALERFRTFRSAGQFVPLSVGKDTVVFPGFDGGGEWGGPAVDPETKILYVNSNDVAWTGALTERTGKGSAGRQIYMNQCAICHRDNMAGSPPEFPSLQNIGSRSQSEGDCRDYPPRPRTDAGVHQPSDDQLTALVHFVVGIPDKEEARDGEQGPRAGVSVYRIRQVPRPGWLPRRCASLGHLECHQPRYR